ncbi:MAG: T9SS type A sorting domain-containing protein [Bacteroidota bacterium]|nr:T9SS type A sorting domain-containing protein [Bacteroidota bacterium]
MSIFNPKGQLIETMVQKKPMGEQKVQWNAEGLPAGLYITQFQAGNNIVSRKLLLAP